MVAIKIRTGSMAKNGRTTLPASWVNDVGLKPSDKVEFLRDEQDRLIVVPSAKKSGGGE